MAAGDALAVNNRLPVFVFTDGNPLSEFTRSGGLRQDQFVAIFGAGYQRHNTPEAVQLTGLQPGGRPLKSLLAAACQTIENLMQKLGKKSHNDHLTAQR